MTMDNVMDADATPYQPRKTSIERYMEKLEREKMFASDACQHAGPIHLLESTKEIICADCKANMKSEDYDWIITRRRQSKI